MPTKLSYIVTHRVTNTLCKFENSKIIFFLIIKKFPSLQSDLYDNNIIKKFNNNQNNNKNKKLFHLNKNKNAETIKSDNKDKTVNNNNN